MNLVELINQNPFLWLTVLLGLSCCLLLCVRIVKRKKLNAMEAEFEVENMIGLDALVCQRISAQGIGKVTVCIDNFNFEIDALSYAQIELEALTKVKVIKKIDDNTVLVVAI